MPKILRWGLAALSSVLSFPPPLGLHSAFLCAEGQTGLLQDLQRKLGPRHGQEECTHFPIIPRLSSVLTITLQLPPRSLQGGGTWGGVGRRVTWLQWTLSLG